MNDIYLEEYTAEEAVQKYGWATAGSGISYLLDHDYGRIYKEVLEKHLPESYKRNGLRLLEFGCGAGMNLIHVASMVGRMGVPLDRAYGTDFSPKLIQAARTDAGNLLTPVVAKKVEFFVARNETIIDDLSSGLGGSRDDLLGSFHFILGVNTFRYGYRLDKENESAQQLFDLLDKGGVCVMIDMNDKFPLFRSKLRGGENLKEKQFYIPSLKEYVRPFTNAGFQILTAKNFCWTPHSASPLLCTVSRIVAPVLNVVVPSYAMRSLVIAKKPA